MQIGSNPAQFGNRNHYGFRASLPTRRVGDGDLYPCETRGGAGRCCEQETKTEKSGKYEITHVGNGSKGDHSASGTVLNQRASRPTLRKKRGRGSDIPITRSATLFSSVHCTSVPSILRPRPAYDHGRSRWRQSREIRRRRRHRPARPTFPRESALQTAPSPFCQPPPARR